MYEEDRYGIFDGKSQKPLKFTEQAKIMIKMNKEQLKKHMTTYDRSSAEKKLRNAPVGSFIVRPSSRFTCRDKYRFHHFSQSE